MTLPKLSIGLTSYNQAQYLENAILSVLNQTVQPYEFVVSDNYSTDYSMDILSKYKEKIKIIRPQEHLSYRDHVNFLVDNLSGDWFSLLASDDAFKPKFVEIFISKLNIDHNVALVRFGFDLMDKDGAKFKTVKSKSFRKIQSFPGNIIEELVNNINPIWACVIRKDVFNKIGGFDERIPIDADWSMVCRMSTYGVYQYIPISISEYRFDYRPNIQLERLKLESIDHANIANIIQKEIFLVNNLSLRLWKLGILQNLSNRIKLYVKYELDYYDLFDLYKIEEYEFNNFGLFDKIELYVRIKLLKI